MGAGGKEWVSRRAWRAMEAKCQPITLNMFDKLILNYFLLLLNYCMMMDRVTMAAAVVAAGQLHDLYQRCLPGGSRTHDSGPGVYVRVCVWVCVCVCVLCVLCVCVCVCVLRKRSVWVGGGADYNSKPNKIETGGLRRAAETRAVGWFCKRLVVHVLFTESCRATELGCASDACAMA